MSTSMKPGSVRPNGSTSMPQASVRSPVGSLQTQPGSVSLPSSVVFPGTTTLQMSDVGILASPPAGLKLHSSFAGWAKNADVAGFKLILWVEDHKEILPLAALRDDTSPITEKHVESKGDITTFTLDSKSALGFSTNCIASLRHYKQKHAFKSNDDKLQYLSDGRGNDWKDVIGDLFRFPGGTTYITSTSDPTGTKLITDSLQEGSGNARWEVQNDKSVKICEQNGQKQVGSIVADNSIQGFIVVGPVTLENDPTSSPIRTAHRQTNVGYEDALVG